MNEELQNLMEAAPPGPWGDWARYMMVHHPEVKPGIVFGRAWKNHKEGKEPPVLSKKMPSERRYISALNTVRKKKRGRPYKVNKNTGVDSKRIERILGSMDRDEINSLFRRVYKPEERAGARHTTAEKRSSILGYSYTNHDHVNSHIEKVLSNSKKKAKKLREIVESVKKESRLTTLRKAIADTTEEDRQTETHRKYKGGIEHLALLGLAGSHAIGRTLLQNKGKVAAGLTLSGMAGYTTPGMVGLAGAALAGPAIARFGISTLANYMLRRKGWKRRDLYRTGDFDHYHDLEEERSMRPGTKKLREIVPISEVVEPGGIADTISKGLMIAGGATIAANVGMNLWHNWYQKRKRDKYAQEWLKDHGEELRKKHIDEYLASQQQKRKAFYQNKSEERKNFVGPKRPPGRPRKKR